MAAAEDDVPMVEDVEEEEHSGKEDMMVDEESDDDDDDQTSQSKKVPVSVITGFLGSGKSTVSARRCYYYILCALCIVFASNYLHDLHFATSHQSSLRHIIKHQMQYM